VCEVSGDVLAVRERNGGVPLATDVDFSGREIPPHQTENNKAITKQDSKNTYGMNAMSVKGPVKNRLYGSPSSFSCPCRFFLASPRPSFTISVGWPNSDGTKSLTEVDLAAFARSSCLPSAALVTVLMTTSTPAKAAVRVEGES
jgi:hypothetical protein